MTRIAALQRMLRPESIAVVGGEFAAEVIRQCDKIGYRGDIWPINPRRESMVGRSCFARVDQLPRAPDAAFIAVSREKTIEIVSQLADLGAGGAVCFASGFAEVGGAGIALQKKLVSSMGEMAIVGPNCYGLLNYLDGVTLWPDQHGGERVKQGAAIIIQSGNIGVSLTMQQRSLPLAYMISIGNRAGIATHDYIEVLLEDARVTAIGLHIEGLDNIPAFSRAALKALEQGIPLVVLKSGTSDRGRELALSHTSSLAGADQFYDALFERVGVIRVHTMPQFVEALKFLAIIGPLPGADIASISCSGGEAALIADLVQAQGLSLAPLEAEQRAGLQKVLGEKVIRNNPLDYHTYIWGNEEAQYRCFSAMLQGKQDITLKVLDYPRLDRCDPIDWVKTASAFQRAIAAQGGRGVIVSTLQENLPAPVRELLMDQGIAPMQGIEECLIAIRAAAKIFSKQQRHAEIQPVVNTFATTGEVTILDELQSKELLQSYGIPVPQAASCSAEATVSAARKIGFPVAVKIASATVIHKSDQGGVQLNLQDESEVRAAVAGMRHLSDRFLVEAMAPKPVAELILGITRDAQFGLGLVIGAGGIFVELLQDAVTLLFPIERADVERALASLKIAPLLEGHRGQPPGDRPAIVAAVLALAQLAEDCAAQLVEIDINPLMVLPAGQGVLAVDAVIRKSIE